MSAAPGAAEVRAWVAQAGRICVLTGAGISTDSGIPDFRGPAGLWTKDPGAERLSDLRHYRADLDLRRRVWRNRLEHPARGARPNAGHLALAALEWQGRLDTLITQNIDGLHQAAGTSPERLVELHGSMREVICLDCRRRGPMEQALARVRQGELDPACRECGGILKSATISFGEPLGGRDLSRAQAAARRCDLFLAVGTSLQVFPAAELPAIALRRGTPLVVVNAQPTGYDRLAKAVLQDPISQVLPRLVGNDPDDEGPGEVRAQS